MSPSPQGQSPGSTPKRLVMTLPRQLMTRRITMEMTTQNRQAQTEMVPFASALIIKIPKESPEMERKTSNTVKMALSMRLSIYPDWWSTDLWPKNSLELLKRSCWLPSLWTAMLMAATHVTSLMTSTVVWQNAQLVMNYQGKYFDKGSSDNHNKKARSYHET